MSISRRFIWLAGVADVEERWRLPRQVDPFPDDPETPVWVFIAEGNRPPIEHVDEDGRKVRSAPESRVLHVASAVDRATLDGAFLFIYGWTEMGSPVVPERMPLPAGL